MKTRRSLHLAGLWVLFLLAAGSALAPLARPDNLRFIIEYERRTPAPWPRPASWRDFFREDTYTKLSAALEESVPLRSWMIFFRNIAERDWFGRTRFGDVDRGREGWLFARAAYHRPEETPAQIDRVLAAFAAPGAPGQAALNWVVIPEKHILYPEYLSASARWFADGFAWRHERLASFMERRGPAGGCFPLWRAYADQKNRARAPLYFRTDSHHTPATSLIAMWAVVEACAPGLWRGEWVRSLGTRIKFGDLSIFVAGQLGSRPELEERWTVRRPGVEMVSGEWVISGRRLEGDRPEEFWRLGTDLYGPHLDWHQTCRFRNRSTGLMKLVPGRTLIIHDSGLAEARESLRQYFADVTFSHYDDIIAADDFGGLLSRFDHVVVEVGERMAIEKMEALLRPVRTRVLARYDGATRPGLLLGNGEVRWGTEGSDLVLTATGPDPFLTLPATPLPASGSYELRVELETPMANTAQLFTRTRLEPEYRESRSRYRKLLPGWNVIYFPLTAEQAGQPLRFDFGVFPGRYRIRSLEIRRWQDAPATADAVTARTPALWVFQSPGHPLPVVTLGAVAAGSGVSLTSTAQGLRIVQSASGELELPPLDPAVSSALSFNLDLEAEHGDWGGIIANGEADPKQSWRLHPGLNRIRLPLGAAAFDQNLRFQPGRNPGGFILRRLSIAGVQPPADAARPAGAPLAWTATLLTAADGLPGRRVETQARAIGAVRLQTGPDGLLAQAADSDPQLIFPAASGTSGGLCLIHIDLETPVATFAQLFFLAQGMTSYQESLSLGQTLPAGRQNLWFAVPVSDLAQPWRFDPGCNPGTYRLRAVEVIPVKLTP